LKIIILLSSISISSLSLAKAPTVDGQKLLLEASSIKFYVSEKRTELDTTIQKYVTNVVATIDDPRSKNIHLVYYYFDCKNRTVSGQGFLFDRKTGKSFNAPPNIQYNINSYSPVSGATLTYKYYAYSCLK
jgi:hypothetical protein